MTTSPYTATVGGSSVNIVAGSINIKQEIGQRSTGSVQVWSSLGTYWAYGTQVLIYDETSVLVYAGYVSRDRATKSGARLTRGYLEHELTLMDNAYRADKRVVYQRYTSRSAGAIAQDLVTRYLASEGVTYTTSSIATGPTISEKVWNGAQISEALNWLAAQAGYWWQIDESGVLWFQPYGGISAPFTLDGTQVDAFNVSVEYGNDLYINKQYVDGSWAEKGSSSSQLHESFKGDGASRAFALSYPVNTLYSVLLNSADVTAQVATKGSTGKQWYYAQGDPIIAQDPGQTVLISSDTLEVYYTGRYPVRAVAQNPALIAIQAAREGSGSSGIVEAVYSNSQVHSLTAAFQIANSLLSHYGQDMTVIQFDTKTRGLAPGQLLTVNLSDFGLSSTSMLIASVAISDQSDGYVIWYHVTAVAAVLESAQWQTYWQNLMRQSTDSSDLTTADTSVALLLASTATHAHSAMVTTTKVMCPIIDDSTIISNTLIIC
jgi:hypothetical protein